METSKNNSQKFKDLRRYMDKIVKNFYPYKNRRKPINI